MSKFFAFLMIGFSVAAFQSCTYKDKETLYPADLSSCDTTNIKYSTYVGSFISSTCATSGCHNASSKSGNVDLSTYAGIKSIVDDGRLMNTINWVSGYSPMPQNQSKLDACTINKIQAWVNNGALNN